MGRNPLIKYHMKVHCLPRTYHMRLGGRRRVRGMPLPRLARKKLRLTTIFVIVWFRCRRPTCTKSCLKMCGRKNAIICISVCVFVCVRGYVNVLDMTIECIVVVSQDLNQRDVNVDREPVFSSNGREEKKNVPCCSTKQNS